MKKLYTLLAAWICLALGAAAQCPYDNVQFGTSTAPVAVGTPTTLTSCIFGGEFRRVTGMTIGETYTIATCGDTDFDTQVTLYPAGGGTSFAFNDDLCGLQSSITFTATSTDMDVLVDQFNCVSNSTCMTLTMTRLSGLVADPCATANLDTLLCDVPTVLVLAGPGAGWNVTSCGFTTAGAEQVYTFTAPYTGVYSLNVTAGNDWVDYFFKPTSAGCDSTGWTCIDDIFGGTSATFTLTAGTYFILADAENVTTTTHTFNISCTPPDDPCDSILPTACGIAQTVTLEGTGAGWSPGNCGFTTPGEEQVYLFTAPTTGTYSLTVGAGNNWVDYFFKPLAAGCGPTGWTCIDDIFSNTSVTFTLTAGVYYILLDAESVTATTHTFTIDCPQAIPANDSCAGAMPLVCGQTVLGNTIFATPDVAPACNGFTVGTGGGLWYSVVGTGGFITASLCDAATLYDSKIHVYEGSCTTPICVTADDDGCDSPALASTVTWCSDSGTTYYILVNGFLTASGPFSLTINCNQPTVAIDPVGPLCVDDAPVTLTAEPPGGTFSGPGVTGNTFDPGATGPGTFVISYSICGVTATDTVVVNDVPANDSCDGAITIAPGNSYCGNTLCATPDPGLPYCTTTGGTAPGVWYTFVGNGNLWTFTTCNAGTDYDTKLHAFTDVDCDSLAGANCVAGNDDIGAACTTGPGTPVFKSEISFCTSPGVTYHVLVHGFGSSSGNFCLDVSEAVVAPTITCPADTTVTLDSTCSAVLPDFAAQATASDDCGVASVTQSPAAGTVITGPGTTTVTVTATDSAGNATTCTVNFTTEDNTPPTAVCQNTTVQLDANGMGCVSGSTIAGGSTDNCGPLTFTPAQFCYTCADVGTPQPAIVTVTDGSGNSSTCTAIVTVEDNVPPTAVCQNVTLQLDIDGNSCITPADVDAGSSDACGIASMSLSQSCFGCSDLGENTVVLTVTDVNGNSSTCTAIVTVEASCNAFFDACPSNIVRNCNSTGNCGNSDDDDDGHRDDDDDNHHDDDDDNHGWGCNQNHNHNFNCGGNSNNFTGACVSWPVPTAQGISSCPVYSCPSNPYKSGFYFLGEVNGHRYYRSSSSSYTWTQARNIATNNGGTLVTINNAGENNFLTGALTGNHAYWIGIHDANVEGTYQWQSGEVSGYTNWAPGEPNNQSSNGCCIGADYGTINANDGKWADRGYCQQYGFVMEINCMTLECEADVNQVAGPPPGSFFEGGTTTTITYVATGAGGGATDTCSFTVTVPECPINYCEMEGSNSCYEWIRNVTLANLNNTSGNNGGYQDFSQYSATVARGSTYPISVRPGFPGMPHNVYWRVWIDWNRDGDFTDSGERVFQGSGSGILTGSVTVPSNAALGTRGMRVAMRYGGYPSGPCTDFSYGEVEDYDVVVTGPNARIVPTASGQTEEEAGQAEAPSTQPALSGLELLDLYPVPVATELHVSFLSSRAENVTIQVMAMDGKVVMQEVRTAMERDNLFTIDVSRLPAGNFLVKLTNGTQSFTEKFVKQ